MKYYFFIFKKVIFISKEVIRKILNHMKNIYFLLYIYLYIYYLYISKIYFLYSTFNNISFKLKISVLIINIIIYNYLFIIILLQKIFHVKLRTLYGYIFLSIFFLLIQTYLIQIIKNEIS